MIVGTDTHHDPEQPTMNSSNGKSPLERWCLLVCLGLSTVQAWILRYAMISDRVSYLDIGDAYFRRDRKAAINDYWSPLYSWCLGLALYLARPSIWWEFVVVHIVKADHLRCGSLLFPLFSPRSVAIAQRNTLSRFG